MIPSVGSLVRVRARRHVVEAVDAPSGGWAGEQHRVALSCIEDDAAGEASVIYWESEPDAKVISVKTALSSTHLDPPDRFAAWYHTLRWQGLSVVDRSRFQAPYRAGISVEAYQFEPLVRALRQPRVNLFIADDVGLGKTIEAGLIVRELLLRQRLRRVVVAAPAGVVSQWRDELDQRFGLPFVIVDREYLRARRRERGWRFNPWEAHARFIVSHALLRDPHYTQSLTELLQRDRAGSLLVLDEAHHAAPSSGGRIAVDSHFTRTLRKLAPLFEHRVFLSATPHNGHSNSFSALMDLLDPTRFVRGLPVEPRLRDEVMVRRLKSELRGLGVEFPQRKIVRVELTGLAADDPDLRLPLLLDRYIELREQGGASLSRRDRQTLSLTLGNLKKRLASSIYAFDRTLAAHRRGLEAKGLAAVEGVDEDAMSPPGSDDERAALPPDQLELSLGEAVAAASARFAAAAMGYDAVALLDELTALASANRSRPDARIARLVAWIRQACLDPAGRRWGPKRVIVFTEYIDTQRYIVSQLERAFAQTDLDRRIATLDGQPQHADQKDDVKARFNTDPAQERLRILVCTDAAREGINLHAHCADLFHYDLPWNPSRLEQRNGRIDRKGQPSPEVRCHYFAWPQRVDDVVLTALVEKTETIRKELGSLGEVIAFRIERALRRPVTARNAAEVALQIRFDFAGAPDDEGADAPSLQAKRRVVQAELGDAPDEAAIRRAKERNDQLRDQAERAMGFSERAFRHALNAALALLGAPPLVRDADDGALWHFPPLDGSPATAAAHKALGVGRGQLDRSWAETLDTLRYPPGREPGFDEGRYELRDRWAWRRHSRLRPVRFRASATRDEASVHLHLEHRVAQRLLGQFGAQGFARDQLARVTVLATELGREYVVLLGRLTIFGTRGQRLHDELVSVGAAWPGPVPDTGERPTPLAVTEAGVWTERLQGALADADGDFVASDFVRAQFLKSVASDAAALEPSLRRLATTKSEVLRTSLAREGHEQAEALTALLTAQRDRLAAQRLATATGDASQPTLPLDRLSDDERSTLQANLRYWAERMQSIDRELAHEPGAVRASYEPLLPHFELVGLVYLTRH